jgi:hypothetical protein
VEEDNWIEHNLMAFVHVIGSPSSGPLQEGTTSVEVAVRGHMLLLMGLPSQPAGPAAAGTAALAPWPCRHAAQLHIPLLPACK